MACGATLKRSLDFDPLHTVVSTSPSHAPIVARTPPSKRRRLSPRCGSVFSNAECRMSSGSPSQSSSSLNPSPFKPMHPISSEAILKNIFDEYKRMKRRRQLQLTPDTPSASDTGTQNLQNFTLAHASGSSAPFQPSSPLPSTSGAAEQQQDKKVTNTPLLTMKQVGMICERLLKEQEEKLRSEYEKVLVLKLSEQYDAFVKFNYDQVQRRLNECPASYVS
ncbi:akirin-2-like [Styela clava]